MASLQVPLTYNLIKKINAIKGVVCQYCLLLRVIKMVAKNGSDGVWRGDTAGHCSTFITSLFRESAEQKAKRPRNYEGSWFSSLC